MEIKTFWKTGAVDSLSFEPLRGADVTESLPGEYKGYDRITTTSSLECVSATVESLEIRSDGVWATRRALLKDQCGFAEAPVRAEHCIVSDAELGEVAHIDVDGVTVWPEGDDSIENQMREIEMRLDAALGAA